MFEARAILLGRMGKHEGALETYVYRLRDYIKAEEYVHNNIHEMFLTASCKILQEYLRSWKCDARHFPLPIENIPPAIAKATREPAPTCPGTNQ